MEAKQVQSFSWVLPGNSLNANVCLNGQHIYLVHLVGKFYKAISAKKKKKFPKLAIVAHL